MQEKKTVVRGINTSRGYPWDFVGGVDLALTLSVLGLISILCLAGAVAAQGQSQPTPLAGSPEAQSSQADPSTMPRGSISGTVLDPDGAMVANVKISLMQPGIASVRETTTDGSGHFVFSAVGAGAFQLKLVAPGFAVVEKSGVVKAAEDVLFGDISLAVHTNENIDVTLAPEQVAEDQLKVEEQQRVLGFIPNFYISYVPNAAPLTTRLKFQLAWKSTVDPVSLGITGAVAGIEQAENRFSGYGQGAQGYGKRYGASYGDFVSGTFIGGAILPSLLKQDPRYFYKGTGTTKSRILYAIAMSVICKGDNGRWQFNYSAIIGGLAAAGISNLYYPPENRDGARLTFENTLIGIGGGMASNIIQEFFVRRFTPHLPSQTPASH
jgi:hypothetical protein